MEGVGEEERNKTGCLLIVHDISLTSFSVIYIYFLAIHIFGV